MATALFLVFFKDHTFLKDVHFLLVAPVVCSVLGLALVLATLWYRWANSETFTWMFDPVAFRVESEQLAQLKWYQPYRILSIILIIFTLGFVYVWR